jgi:5-formyltetrahydrofolate cyclo-ligase
MRKNPHPKTPATDDAKKTFRRVARQRLRSLSMLRAYRIDHAVRTMLKRRMRTASVRAVMLYVPLKGEVDLLPLIGWLRRKGVRVFVPFMEGASFRLVQYRLPLRHGRFGVREPRFSNQYREEKIDIAIIPIVGVDPTGRRIGFGQGMYDRFFAREGDRICWTIFVQRSLQYSPVVLTDVHDVRADEIITGS